eukprot:CAMPEP_0194764664 /NCGR_PEP_ID=MMETSP0323_2-20130528/23606_1 /TAXON_ID=2866 ORGANISM="Crypthecodinium cohnii, Strain Seligo" /NCGR_SAMPLE_ID=MMETSP0323_2 /ASSEMBLY_ACC=CAM_ASM_000346 /LENGTH=216 /DNA_ID=CAMNT_0039692415 /DNA_START=63 /DNA_END=713 /DNA_ORIENTATION=+
MTGAGNHVIPNVHFRKVNGMTKGQHYRAYFRTWFDQPAKAKRRSQTRKAKAAKIFPRPVGGLLRPVVHCPTSRYNMKVRLGRGFSLDELKEAGIPVNLAPTIGIAVDWRRKNRNLEGMQANVDRLKLYQSKLVVFPKRAGAKNVKKGDTPKSELKNVAQNTLKEIIPFRSKEKTGPMALAQGMKDFKAFRTMRKARADKKKLGKRMKEEAENKKAE